MVQELTSWVPVKASIDASMLGAAIARLDSALDTPTTADTTLVLPCSAVAFVSKLFSACTAAFASESLDSAAADASSKLSSSIAVELVCCPKAGKQKERSRTSSVKRLKIVEKRAMFPSRPAR